MKVYLTLMLMLGSLVAFSQDYPGAGYVAKVKNVKFKSGDQKTGRYIAILTDNSVLDIKYNDVPDTEIAAMYSFISIPSGFDGFLFKGDQNFIFLNSRLPFLFTVMGFKPGEIKEIKAAVTWGDFHFSEAREEFSKGLLAASDGGTPGRLFRKSWGPHVTEPTIVHLPEEGRSTKKIKHVQEGIGLNAKIAKSGMSNQEAGIFLAGERVSHKRPLRILVDRC